MKSFHFLATLTLCCSLSFHVFADEKTIQEPAWLQEGIIYSIFPRNFSPSGDIPGVTDRLQDLKDLGVTILWLLPLHPIGEHLRKGTIGSPYSVQDYYVIHPDYGTKSDLKQLVTKAHQLGLKVIIDVVLNHTAWDNALTRSPELYLQDEEGQIIPPVPDWSDVAALNYKNPALRTYMIDVLKYWLMEFDLDGFRYDAVGMVPLDFWLQARQELLKIKSDILLLGEGDKPEALGIAYDIDYAWKFEKALNEVIVQGAPATAHLKKALENEKKQFSPCALHLRFSDNHDKKRSIVRYGEKGALAASALLFTLDGVPLIYNGMEIGDTAETHPPALFEKIPIFWPSAEIRPEFPRFYREIIALRKKYPSLRSGELIWLKNSDEERIVTYLRRTLDEECLIVINFSNRPFIGTIDLDPHVDYVDMTPLSSLSQQNQFPSLNLKAWEFRIYTKTDEKYDIRQR